jgi:hypothetical protein
MDARDVTEQHLGEVGGILVLELLGCEGAHVGGDLLKRCPQRGQGRGADYLDFEQFERRGGIFALLARDTAGHQREPGV